MKTQAFWRWTFGIALVAVPAAVAWLPRQPSPSELASIETVVETNFDAANDTDVPDDPLMDDPAQDSAEASAEPVATKKPLPANVKLSPAAAELLKLVESRVEENVMLAFAKHSPKPFELSSDDIIYLTDVGVSPDVVSAMLQRDHALEGAEAPNLSSPTPNFININPPPQAAVATFVTEPAIQLSEPALEEEYATEPFPQQLMSEPPPAQEVGFYDSLAPYGSWVSVEGYGQCWQPTVVTINSGWRPYCDRGHWVYSDCGWYWASDYTWGWAPFHYGRWFQDNRLGWCWTPGTVWGPSWVCWRQADDYCGWAPLPPAAGFSLGVGLTFGGRPAPANCSFALSVGSFSFVRTSDLFAPRLNNHALTAAQASAFYAQSEPSSRITHRGGQSFHHGPAASRVVAATHRELRPVSIRELRPTPGRTSTTGNFAGSPWRSSGTTTHAATAASGGRDSHSLSPRPTQTAVRGQDHNLNPHLADADPATAAPVPAANSVVLIGRRDRGNSRASANAAGGMNSRNGWLRTANQPQENQASVEGQSAQVDNPPVAQPSAWSAPRANPRAQRREAAGQLAAVEAPTPAAAPPQSRPANPWIATHPGSEHRAERRQPDRSEAPVPVNPPSVTPPPHRQFSPTPQPVVAPPVQPTAPPAQPRETAPQVQNPARQASQPASSPSSSRSESRSGRGR